MATKNGKENGSFGNGSSKNSIQLVLVAIFSALCGALLSQHILIHMQGSVSRTGTNYVYKKSIVVLPTAGRASSPRLEKEIERGLPTPEDPSGRSGLVPTVGKKEGRKIRGLSDWEKVRLPSTLGEKGRRKPSMVPEEFCESSAARLEDIVIVVGGFLCDFNRVTDAVQLYNRSTGIWTSLTKLPETAAKTHQGAAAIRSPTDPNSIWLYLVSGQIGPGCTVGTTESWALQIRKKKQVWSKLPDLPEVRYAPSAYVSSGFLHVVGGAGPNRLDPKSEHWVLPLAPNGRPISHAGWFLIDQLPDGGADSAGFAVARGYAFRFGGQHGHPRAVNILTDNNKQCQDSPEVAHLESYRRPLNQSHNQWRMVAPMPWPASHIGLSTVATDDEAQILVVSGKKGKEVTRQIALYDLDTDHWSIIGSIPLGQPDYLVWLEAGYLHALKFRWHPTNSTLNPDFRTITKHYPVKKIVNWPQAYTHIRAKVLYHDSSLSKDVLETPQPYTFETKPIRTHFGVQILNVDLKKELSKPAAQLALFGKALRDLADRYGLLHFPSRTGTRQIEPKELVALHALFDHDQRTPPSRFHKGMCRLWRSGLPQVNLLANKAASAHIEALKDDGTPCSQNTVYGMETYAWHADESSRPDDLSVRYTVFHAAVMQNASQGETHFASAAAAYERLDHTTKQLAASIDVKYLTNPKSLDAFLPPLDIAGKRDALLEKDGVAKHASEEAAIFMDQLVNKCQNQGTCRTHTSPLVVPHPRTGRPALHLDVKQQIGFTGLNFSHSQNLLVNLLRPATSPNLIYRHRWQVGDVVVADNFNVLHTAAPGEAFNDAARLIERICVPGGYVPQKVPQP